MKQQGIVPDVIYIDADHHYDPCLADIRASLRAFPDALCVGDDYGNYEGRSYSQEGDAWSNIHVMTHYNRGQKCGFGVRSRLQKDRTCRPKPLLGLHAYQLRHGHEHHAATQVQLREFGMFLVRYVRGGIGANLTMHHDWLSVFYCDR